MQPFGEQVERGHLLGLDRRHVLLRMRAAGTGPGPPPPSAIPLQVWSFTAPSTSPRVFWWSGVPGLTQNPWNSVLSSSGASR